HAAAGAPLRRRAVGASAGRAAARPAGARVRGSERAVRLSAVRGADDFLGHPRGLVTLFFTETWERFSYYGMRAFLILYMVHALGFDDRHAGAVYGTYTGSVWFAAIFGGIIADRWRSEEHTSELQSRFDLVCRLLLEKKKE